MHSIFEVISRVVRNPSNERDDGSKHFIARCENFRLLLAANSKALEIMAEMSRRSRFYRNIRDVTCQISKSQGFCKLSARWLSVYAV